MKELHANQPTDSDIARLAYEFWEQEGHPEGRDLEHWTEAEAVLSYKPEPYLDEAIDTSDPFRWVSAPAPARQRRPRRSSAPTRVHA